MLAISFKIGETIKIGEDVVVKLLDVRGRQARLGITAPRGKLILRDDVGGTSTSKDSSGQAGPAAPPADNE